ncbi:uncharacterized protein [Littorina saxatilis]|uniref:uncharacterized protein n=1 Tax=Littorina saxatilis TaxID=31220 RepID=UPI0038B594D9
MAASTKESQPVWSVGRRSMTVAERRVDNVVPLPTILGQGLVVHIHDDKMAESPTWDSEKGWRHTGYHVVSSARVSNPAKGADNRRMERSPERPAAQSLPAARHNGYLVTSDPVTQERLTYYHSDAHGVRAEHVTGRRQQSLPSSRPRGEARHRHALSAPSRKHRTHSQPPGGPLPQINNLMARSRGQTGDTTHVVTTNFAGISTRDQEANQQKSNKFASNWAQVRAENHLDVNTSPKTSPRHGVPEDKSRDKSPDVTSDHKKQGTSPDRTRAKGGHQQNKQEFAFHAKLRDKENIRPENSTQKKETSSNSVLKTQQKDKERRREDKEKLTIRFVTPEDGREQNRPDTDVTDHTDVTEDSGHSSPHTKRRKPAWNNRFVKAQPHHRQPTVTSWKRYEAELTHVPELTSTDQVYKTYTGRSKRELRDEDLGEWGDPSRRDPSSGDPGRPTTKGSSKGDRREGEERKEKEEYVLTRNEAKTYLHLQNVYGCDAYRRQRKECFFKRLTDAQLQELKLQAEDKRRNQRKREESKRMQKRQLSYVRRKFRREQLHRFRTQYVTSRVLEYERGDRDQYGLPAEWDDEEEGEGEGGESGGYGDESSRETTTDDPESQTRSPHTPGHTGKETKLDVNDATESGTQDIMQDTSTQRESTNQKNRADEKKSGGLQSDKQTTETTAQDPKAKTKVATQKASSKATDSSRKGADKKGVSDGASAKLTDTRGEIAKPGAKGDSIAADTKSVPTQDTIKSSPTERHTSVGHKTTVQRSRGGEDGPVQTSLNSRAADEKTTRDDVGAKHTQLSNTGDSATKNNVVNAQAAGLPHTKTQTVKEEPSSQQTKGDTEKGTRTSTKNKTKTNGNTQNRQNKPATTANKSDTKAVTQMTNKQISGKTGNNPPLPSVNDPQTATNKANGKSGSNSNTVNPKLDETVAKKETAHEVESTKREVNTTPSEINTKSEQTRGADSDSPRKATTMTKDSRGRYITTTRNFGPRDPSPPIKQHTEAGQSAHSPQDSNNQTSRSNKPAQHTAHTTTQSKHTHDKTQANRQSDSRGRKQKVAHAQSKTEAEQKKQLERKFGKMFEVSTGPSWTRSSKQPKMEGIDTVMVKVTDSKGEPVTKHDGRTKMKKREVKDVVKEAQRLTVPEPDSPRRENAKGGKQAESSRMIRTASVDTLDFDDDDDEEQEDVFERVRRKYNLQIDSDDDDISRT